MPVEIEVDEELDELADVDREIPMSELFTREFMETHSDVDSFDELVAVSPWTVDSTEDFEALPGGEWDNHVRRHTVFKDWDAMLRTAARKWWADVQDEDADA